MKIWSPAIEAFIYINIGVKIAWRYRLERLCSIVGINLQVIMLYRVWSSLYKNSDSINGISAGQAVSYAILASCMYYMAMPWRLSDIEDRIRSGNISIDVSRPTNFLLQTVSQQVGYSIAQFPGCGVALILAKALGVITLPSSNRLALYFISLALGIAQGIISNVCVSFLCFWSTETAGYFMVYRLVVAVGSGALVPFWFMPKVLVKVLNWLPMRTQISTPLTVYFDNISGGQIWIMMGNQVLWLFIFFGLATLLWKYASRRMEIFGG